jgi:hypothetical protein
MCAVWNERKGNPGLILAEINKSRVEDSGKVIFKGMGVEWFESALLSAVQFDTQIPEAICPSLIQHALFRTTHSRRLSANELITTISEEERRYLRRPVQELYVRTSISAEGQMPFRTARFNRILFSLRQQRRFDRSAIVDCLTSAPTEQIEGFA